jgi:hypothetical protein
MERVANGEPELAGNRQLADFLASKFVEMPDGEDEPGLDTESESEATLTPRRRESDSNAAAVAGEDPASSAAAVAGAGRNSSAAETAGAGRKAEAKAAAFKRKRLTVKEKREKAAAEEAAKAEQKRHAALEEKKRAAAALQKRKQTAADKRAAAEKRSNEQAGGASASSAGTRKRNDKKHHKLSRKQRVLNVLHAPNPAAATVYHEIYSALYGSDYATNDHAQAEDLIQATVFITVREALTGPQEREWQAAIDEEVAKVESYETWGPPLTPGEIRDKLDAGTPLVPAAIVLTRKRCGRFKARLCALGDRLSEDYRFSVDSYQSTVSGPASRFLLTESAARKYHLSFFDISNAYLHAELPSPILIKLPTPAVAANGQAIRELKKALYGLTESGRLWGKKLQRFLETRGWESCKHEPGLLRKPSASGNGWLILSVYVDDCCACGEFLDELNAEVKGILDTFPGRFIEPVAALNEFGDPVQVYDLLGVDLMYNRERGYMRLSMGTYITKAVTRFGLDGAKPTKHIDIDENALATDQEAARRLQGEASEPPPKERKKNKKREDDGEFPIRGLIGALMWITTSARPDIQPATLFLARLVGRGPTTRGIINAAKKVLIYLAGTKTEGICYHPEKERAFNETYTELLGPDQRLGAFNLFSDASFASCSLSMRSISGSICYYRGTPVAWKSQRQTVRAYSTAESEYIACSDTLVFELGIGFRDFLGAHAPPLLWVDNTSAITIAGQAEDQVRPKNRHFALRLHRVRDEQRRLVFVPTNLQRADPLTKNLQCAEQRELCFFTAGLRAADWATIDDFENGDFSAYHTILYLHMDMLAPTQAGSLFDPTSPR